MKTRSKPVIFGAIALILFVQLMAGAAMAQEAPSLAPAAIALAPAGPAPVPPAMASKAAILFNADDGQVLYSQNADERLPMASTTKMMTALLTVENHRQDMNAVITCSQRAAEVGESSIWMKAGEKLTVKEMLTGLLVQSGNDAAVALAEFDAGSVEAFVEKMNLRAQELGLANTHFANPHGLHDPQHYTSATDLAKLGREVMKHPEIREIVKQPQATISWGGQPFPRTLINHNHLLEIDPAVNGIKTGYTDEAGQCIVISAGRDGTNLILAYLGGPSLSQRNDDVENLLRFGFDSYQQRTVISAGVEYTSLDVPFSVGKKLSLVADGDLARKVLVKDSIEHRLVLPEKPRLPIHKGDKVGLVEAYEGNKYLGSTYLIATSEVSAPGFSDRIGYYVEAIFNILLPGAGSSS